MLDAAGVVGSRCPSSRAISLIARSSRRAISAPLWRRDEGGPVKFQSREWLVLVAMIAVTCGEAAPADAQGLTAQISGTIVDSTKAVIPGASVSVKNADTQV